MAFPVFVFFDSRYTFMSRLDRPMHTLLLYCTVFIVAPLVSANKDSHILL